MDYLSEERVELRYMLPLAEIVFDFFDQLKSRTRGYASLDYERIGDQVADLVKVDILLQGEHGRRVQRDRAQGQGLRVRRDDDGQAQGPHPAPAVRGAHPGGHRRPDHRARDHPGHPQGRPGQVLRRRHHPQAQAAGEAEGGQEAHEDDRPGRGAAGGLHRRAVQRARGVGTAARTRRRSESRLSPTATRRPTTARCRRRRSRAPTTARSASTCTCRSARCAAGTATSTRTRRPSWAAARARTRTRTRRCAEIALAARCWRRGAARAARADGLRRRRHPDRAARPADLARMLDGVRDAWGLAADAEVTTEANPDSVTPESLAALADGRVHAGLVRHAVGGAARARDARPHARPAPDPGRRRAGRATPGCAVSLDLIYGTPGESLDDWRTQRRGGARDRRRPRLGVRARGRGRARGWPCRCAAASSTLPDGDDQAAKYELADDLLDGRRAAAGTR